MSDEPPAPEPAPAPRADAPRNARRVTEGDTVDAVRQRESITWRPEVDGEPVLTPRGNPLEIRWKPTEQGVEVRRNIQAFVDAFARGDYAQARQAARRCGETADVREQHEVVDISLTRLQQAQTDPLEMRAVILEMDRIGEAQHGIHDAGTVHRRDEFLVRLPQPRADLGGGLTVDLVTGASSRPLDLGQQTVVEGFRRSPAGQRLQAEHALTLLEERVHVEQFRASGIMSPSFARFATDVAVPKRGSVLFEALLEVSAKPRTLMEAEIPALLYDAGMPLATIRDHFLARHPQERERILSYLDTREST